jgi:hypothetical protein
MRELVSLDDFNNKHRSKYLETENPKNGIACPNCGTELIDSNPNLVLTSFPPQKNVRCDNCDYTGYRVA